MGKRNQALPEPVETRAEAVEETPRASTIGTRDIGLRVEALERVVAALVFSTFSARDSKGRMLVRCQCGCFATRKLVVNHPVMGNQSEYLCSDCRPATPLATEGVPQTEEKIHEPADLALVKSVNRGLSEARQWGAS